MWDKIICWIVVLLIACGCGTTSPKVIESIRDRTDTVYVSKHQVDSIYVADRERVYVVKDTVFVERVREQYKYKVRVDTVYKAQVDSVVVVREVPVVQEKPYVPKVMWWLAGFGVVSILLMVLWLLRKFNIV